MAAETPRRDAVLAEARRRVLLAGLDGASNGDLEPLVLEPNLSEEWRHRVVDDRLVGLALEAVDRGAVEPQPADVDVLRAAHEQSLAVALALEAELLDAVEVLGERGVDHRVLKGAALAHVAYPRPEWREFGDVDLLVRGDELPRAVEVLERSGATRRFPSLGARYERQAAKGVTMRSRAGWELDLHRTIATGPWGQLVEVEDLWADPVEYQLAGVALRTLPPEAHLAHALVHVGLGSPTPRGSNLRDLLQLAAREDLHEPALQLLAGWSSLTPARAARGLLPDGLRARLGWLGDGAATPRERRWIRLHRRDPQPFGRLTLESLLVVPPSRLHRHLLALAPLLRPGSRRGRDVRSGGDGRHGRAA